VAGWGWGSGEGIWDIFGCLEGFEEIWSKGGFKKGIEGVCSLTWKMCLRVEECVSFILFLGRWDELTLCYVEQAYGWLV
jgi:hypothetical protein